VGVAAGGEGGGDGGRSGLVALRVLLVVLDLEPGVGERRLEALARGVEGGVGDDLGDADRVALGVPARGGRGVGAGLGAAAVLGAATGEGKGGGGQDGAGKPEG